MSLTQGRLHPQAARKTKPGSHFDPRIDGEPQPRAVARLRSFWQWYYTVVVCSRDRRLENGEALEGSREFHTKTSRPNGQATPGEHVYARARWLGD